MAVPATTGVLREKISDMEIGDYIKANMYTGATSLNYGFAGLGEKTNALYVESPLTGSAFRNNKDIFFYFVKVAKGLLVADRVALHSISWDTINTIQNIQGHSWDSGNTVPTMTSNTSPRGVVSASSSFNTRDPYRAFDGSKATSVSNSWLTVSGNTVGWLAYEFDTPVNVVAYSISSANDSTAQYDSRMPKDWVFEGSQDGINWVALNAQKGITTWEKGVKKYFSFANTASYKAYRLNITANNGDSSYLGLSELEMYDQPPGIIRSLTGGVAYVDENGDMSTTDKGLGAWPQNNEWDKYIVNFPQELIQEGKALDDVFHWNGIFTWCQDTQTILLPSGTSGRRAQRGKTKAEIYSYHNSNISQVDIGFRPVFEYRGDE